MASASSAGMVIDMPTLHTGQEEVRLSPARFRVLACGRRWGKTRLAAALAMEQILTVPDARVWWVAPTYQISEVGWREMVNLARQIEECEVRRGERSIRCDDATITVRSADDPQHLRGEGLDMLIMDEAAYCSPDTWSEVLRPALMDRQGKALFLSTPRGKNWFYALTQSRDPDLAWWQFPTSANPFIQASEIEQARRVMPAGRFAQEVMGDFVDFEGRVFPELTRFSQRGVPNEAGRYVFGIDWGRSVDFTQIAILDRVTDCMAELLTLHGDYQKQKLDVIAACKRWNPELVVAEQNSIGQVLIDELSRENIPLAPFTTSNASKMQFIDGLTLGLERNELTLLDDDELRSQFSNYCCELLPSGLARYSAPEGLHDDIVIAVALAWWGVQRAAQGWEARLL